MLHLLVLIGWSSGSSRLVPTAPDSRTAESTTPFDPTSRDQVLLRTAVGWRSCADGSAAARCRTERDRATPASRRLNIRNEDGWLVSCARRTLVPRSLR